MKKIRFTSNYPKLWGQDFAELVAIKEIENITLPFSEELIEYDTKNSNGEYYPLPKNNYLQLIFVGIKGVPFCTIRSNIKTKKQYYTNLIGQQFQIVRGQ